MMDCGDLRADLVVVNEKKREMLLPAVVAHALVLAASALSP